MGQTVGNQHGSAGTASVALQAYRISTLTLVVLAGVTATACGGRTLETAPNVEDGADDGDPSIGGSGNGNNGNAVTTSPDTTTGGGGGSVSAVTSTDGITAGGMGTCDAPYDLGRAVGRFSGITVGPSSFLSVCGGEGSETFWIWTAPEAGTYRINTFGSVLDTVLSQLLQPNCENLGVVQCNDDINGTNDSELLLYAGEGEVLTFVVDSFENGGSFQFEIVRSDDATAACGAVLDALSGVGNPLVNRALPLNEETLHDASKDMCRGMAPRVAFDWTAPNDGTFSFDTMGSNYDTVLVLRTGCDDTVGRVCNDDYGGVVQSLERLAVWAGQVVRVEVAAFDGTFATNDGADPRVTLNVRQE